jgi:transaldolase
MTSSSRWTALPRLGQSVWYDNVARPALTDGHLAELIDRDGVTGGTSNPSIFAKAVLESDLYRAEIEAAPAAASAAEIFERSWIADLRQACDLVRPIWTTTAQRDGYMSIEEEADRAFDVERAVTRAHELQTLVDRPNLMIKLPATDAGVEAFGRLTRHGLNINMTLLFSRERYRQIAEAYIDALTDRLDAGEDVAGVASVASFFVSRIDTQVDRLLPEGSPLRGRIAVANAKLAYADVFLPMHSGRRWERLAAAGAAPQRPLWASTGTKDPGYSPTLYIDELIGQCTVTTVPDATLDAFREAGTPPPHRHSVTEDVGRARSDLAALARSGVDLDDITARLEHDGIAQFADAHTRMLEAITATRPRVGTARARGSDD